MWQVMVFNFLSDLNDWLMEEADNIEEVKEHSIMKRNKPFEWGGKYSSAEYSVLVKMKEVNKDA